MILTNSVELFLIRWVATFPPPPSPLHSVAYTYILNARAGGGALNISHILFKNFKKIILIKLNCLVENVRFHTKNWDLFLLKFKKWNQKNTLFFIILIELSHVRQIILNGFPPNHLFLLRMSTWCHVWILYNHFLIIKMVQ